MLENLFIDSIDEGFNNPQVDFNASTGILTLKGESYVENAKEFYEPLLKWIEDYMEHYQNPLTLNIMLDYFNTSSSRSLQDMFILLRKFEESGRSVTINWFYSDDSKDPELEEEVEDFEIVSGIKINMVEQD